MKRLRVVLAFVLASLSAGDRIAQTYPNRPIRVLVPFAAGGAVDTLARLVGQKLSESIGQPVIIENRPGAGGNLASDVLAKSPPDGYTVLQTVNGIAISPSLYKTLPFDSNKDFVAVTQLVRSQLILVANPKLEANNVAELIALAKAKPGALNYGSTGVGNPLQPDDGDAQERGRHGHPGGDLSRRCAGQRRADRGRNPARRDADGDHAAAGPGRPAQGAGDRRRQALAGHARRADRRRDHSGLRVDELAGLFRAGRHAARHRRCSCSRRPRRCSSCPT